MKKMLYRHSWLGPMIMGGLAALVVLVLLSGQTEYVFAQQASQTTDNIQCSNLDVIFLVDQSSSMSSNDPTQQRKYAVEGMIDLLVDLAIDQCPGSFHRIGVISFGTDVRVDLSMSNISPANAEEGRQLRENLKNNIKVDLMGATNTEDAFNKANWMFNSVGPAPFSEMIRKRVIILITDGFPSCPASNPDCGGYIGSSRSLKEKVDRLFSFDADLLNREECLSSLREDYGEAEIPNEKINKCLSDYRIQDEAYNNSTYVWTILLKSFETPSRNVLDQFNQLTETHAGKLIMLSENLADIPSTLRKILSQLAGIRPNLLDCGAFAVNPYLRQARVTVYGINESNRITLTYKDENGTYHTILNGLAGETRGFTLDEYYTYGTNERYAFAYPYPGIWQLQADNCEGLDVYYETVNVNSQGYQLNIPGQIPQYDLPPYYDVDEPFYLEYQMRDSNSQVVPQANSPTFHINILMAVTDPTGKQIVYPMEWKPQELLFRAKVPLQVPVSGIYTIQIEGTTMKHTGEPVVHSNVLSQEFTTQYTLFKHENLEFSVFPVAPFVIVPVFPKPDQLVGPIHRTIINGWPLKLIPLSVHVRITNRQGEKLTDLNDIFSDPQQALTAELSSGSASSTVITLKPDPNVPGDFVGDITDFDVEGQQSLIIQSGDEYINEQNRPDDRKVEVLFTRVDYLLSRARFYQTVLVIIIVVIVGRIITCGISSSNPVRGQLVLLDGTTELIRFLLANRKLCGKNQRIVSKKELAPYPQLGLKKIRVKNLRRLNRKPSKESETDTVANIFAYGDLASAHPGVNMKCWPFPEGRPYPIDLLPNTPIPIGDTGLIQAKYEPPA